jgi:hypothetical protein
VSCTLPPGTGSISSTTPTDAARDVDDLVHAARRGRAAHPASRASIRRLADHLALR